MRKYSRSIIIALMAFILIALAYPGFDYNSDLGVLILSALVFAFLTIFIKPLLNILSLPFNLLTFGFFSFAVNIIILFAVDYLISDFKIVSFSLQGLTYSGFVIPAWDLNQLFSAVLASFLIGLISTLLLWVFK